MATNKIQIKRRGATGAPTTSQVVQGEMAYNEADDILYIGSGGNGTASSVVKAIAGAGSYVALTGNQTIAGTKTFSTAIATGSGGTGLSSFTSGGAVYATSTSALTTGTLPNTAGGTGQSSAFTQYGVVYGSTTTALATSAAGTSTQVLHGNAAGAPTWGSVSLTADVSGALGAGNGGTGQSTYTAGDLLYASGTTALSKLAATTAGYLLTANGTGAAPSWTQLTSVALSTGTITGIPSSGNDIVNKTYADSIASGINFHSAAQLATTTSLFGTGYTYNNGASGVGATITYNSNAALVVDGVTPAVGNRILVKNETGTYSNNTTMSAAFNGVYTVTTVGSVSVPWVLTRATDYDTSGTGTNEIDQGDFILVINGSTLSNTSWIQQTALPVTVGTTSITFVQFGAGGATYTAGTGLTLSANQFSITNTAVTAASYGDSTGQRTTYYTVNAQGQLTAAASVDILVDGGTY